MNMVLLLFALISLLLAPPGLGQPRPIEGVEILEMTELKTGIEAGQFDVILDVRTQNEWDTLGHIEGATFAENLGSFGSSSSGASPADFDGCEFCSIVVYCRTGARASNALEVLLNNGFEGDLYNGRGSDDWVAAGYDLVFDVPSVEPPCTLNVTDQCPAAAPTAAPTVSSSSVSWLWTPPLAIAIAIVSFSLG